MRSAARSLVTVRDTRLRWPVLRNLPALLIGKKITGTARSGKYLLLQLTGGDRLIIHSACPAVFVLARSSTEEA